MRLPKALKGFKPKDEHLYVVLVKAVATDVDGTLTDEFRTLSHEAIKAIRRLEDKGVPVILASGNALPVMRALQIYLRCTGAIICENGAVVEYKGELRVLGDRKRGEEALKALKEAFGDKVVESWSNAYRYVDFAIKCEVDRRLIEVIIAMIPRVKLLNSGFAYHLVDEKVNKGEGLRVAAQMMKLNLNEVVAIGDGENDIDLLKAAGFGIALAGSPQALKEVANYITSKPNGEGFAEAVEVMLRWA